MAQAYPPLVVVGTLLGPFFEHRGLTPAPRGLGPGPPPAFEDDRIISDMEQFGMVRLDALRRSPRGRRDWVVVLVLSARGKCAHHSPDLRKLLEGVETERPAKEGRLCELIVVAEEEFFARKNLTDLVGELQRQEAAQRVARMAALDEERALALEAAGRAQRLAELARNGGEATAAEAEARALEAALLGQKLAQAEAARRRLAHGDEDGAAPFYSAHPYHNFALVVPDHVSVPPHRLMAAAEVDAFLGRHRLDRSQLPVIRSTDPPIVWLGAREGQVVEISRDSQTAGRALFYRRVERAGF